FMLIWSAINIAPLPPALQMISMVLASICCLLTWTIIFFRKRRSKTMLSWLSKWVLIVQIAFVCTLIFSPVYLNARNILEIFSWTEEWNTPEKMINPHWYDLYTILGFKAGPVLLAM